MPFPFIPAETEAADALRRSGTAAGMNRFAFALFHRRLAGKGASSNVFLSPISVSQAALLLANGSSGDTQTRILDTLCLSPELDTVNRDQKSLNQLLEPPRPVFGKSLYEWAMASAIWTRLAPGKAFAKRCHEFYSADALQLTTAAAINDWAHRKTRGRIPTLVAELNPETYAVLTTAVYFKGAWGDAFAEKDTEANAPFFVPGAPRPQIVPRMHRTADNIAFHEGEGYQAVSLPYHGEMEMVVVLPERGTDPQALAERLDADSWRTMCSRFRQQYVRVGLPKFELSYSAGMLEDLVALGLPECGDYSPMEQGQLFIGEVDHATFLRVDEKGSEAAGATAILMCSGLPFTPTSPPREFIVDRPFLCAIVHKLTDVILFLGLVNEPKTPIE